MQDGEADTFNEVSWRMFDHLDLPTKDNSNHATAAEQRDQSHISTSAQWDRLHRCQLERRATCLAFKCDHAHQTAAAIQKDFAKYRNQ